jgi:hypothetical protein
MSYNVCQGNEADARRIRDTAVAVTITPAEHTMRAATLYGVGARIYALWILHLTAGKNKKVYKNYKYPICVKFLDHSKIKFLAVAM